MRDSSRVPNFVTISLPDDRDVDVWTEGSGEHAVVLQHGTPGNSTTWQGWDAPVVERGFRFVAISRPGYATSARKHGRTVADAAADIEAVLDQLHVSDFVTAGWSGGGPHALATAALLPSCKGVASIAGVGPWGAPDLDFLAGMGPENEEEFGAALEGPDALADWMNVNATEFAQVTGTDIAAAFGGLVPEIDQAALAGGFADDMATSMRRALRHGWTGWADDDFAFIAPWGFELDALVARQIPVTIWQGDLDLMVPAAHGEWLHSHIPGSTVRRVPGHGHISLMVDYRNEIVADLVKPLEN